MLLLGCPSTTENLIDKGTPTVFNKEFLEANWLDNEDSDLTINYIIFGYPNNGEVGEFEVFDKVKGKLTTLTSVSYKNLITDKGLTLVIKNPNGAGEDTFVIKAKAYNKTNAKGTMEWFIENPKGTYVDLKSYYLWFEFKYDEDE